MFRNELAKLLLRPQGATLAEMDAAAHRHGDTYNLNDLRLTARMFGWRLWHLDDERPGVERAYRISPGGEKLSVSGARSYRTLFELLQSGLACAAALALSASVANAQYTTIPTMGGGSYTIGPNGYLATTTRTIGGGSYTLVTPEQPAFTPQPQPQPTAVQHLASARQHRC